MKIKSVQYNIIMNFIRVIFGMMSPIIVMPYINRKFEPKLIGEIEYSTTIITYFILFAGLGISTYGVREISKIRENIIERSKFTFEMCIILFLTNLVSYSLLFIIVYLEILKNINLKILYILSLNIFFTSFNFEWFYQGIEDQEYITKRSVLMKTISVILIFILIKNKNDSISYILILVGSSIFSNAFNIINLKKYLKINKNLLKELKIKKHLKSLFLMFGSSIAILIYTQIDIVMIGNIVGTYPVGLYNISAKILNLGKTLITVVGVTLLPRLTNFYFSNLNDKYDLYLKKSLQILLIYSCYATLFLYVNSSEIIYLFGGNEFEEAIVTLKLQSIIIPISGLAYFYGIIVLYSQKKDKPFLYSVAIAALMNVILNKMLIPVYKQNGAVIATIIAEIVVILSIFILEKEKLKKINFLTLNTIKIIGVGLSILILSKSIKVDSFTDILVKNTLIFSTYTVALIILKEEFLIEIIKVVKLKFKRSKK